MEAVSEKEKGRPVRKYKALIYAQSHSPVFFHPGIYFFYSSEPPAERQKNRAAGMLLCVLLNTHLTF